MRIAAILIAAMRIFLIQVIIINILFCPMPDIVKYHNSIRWPGMIVFEEDEYKTY